MIYEFRSFLCSLAVSRVLQHSHRPFAVVKHGEQSLDGLHRSDAHKLQLLLRGAPAEVVELRHESDIVVLILGHLILQFLDLLLQLGYLLLLRILLQKSLLLLRRSLLRFFLHSLRHRSLLHSLLLNILFHVLLCVF